MATITFWQNIPSIHQAPLIRSLADRCRGQVTLVAEKDVSAERVRQGWQRPDFSPAEVIIAPSREERICILKEHSKESDVHVFTGLRAYKETYWTLKLAAATKAKIGVYLERPRDDQGIKSLLRRLLYTLDGRLWRNRLDFVLATGDLAVAYYEKCGFPRKKLYPFGYFVDPRADGGSPVPPKPVENDSARQVTFIFVGALVRRKAVGQLLQALSTIQDGTWRLLVVGDGPLRAALQGQALRLGINKTIQWLGSVDNPMARTLIESADCLVLPSRFDGWGAVVNEALLSGTPVVVSSACGARDLVESSGHGKVFRAGDVTDLARVLGQVVSEGPLSPAARGRIRAWAEENISPQRAAGYLLDILTHVQGKSPVRPVPPWRGVPHA